ncbi:hypothetical protein PoB_002157400 [Plakobranchus ocellatus]|uniref:Uncharacterized protein n=1 Tax=Plakobranchus ocellatus TaxID=259542 RepID=A0AAV3ZIB7_9GAST|nr:hypothetical protein PoB_002157400 [Plakobranchus ocellatus]
MHVSIHRLIYEASNDYGNLENGEPHQSKRDASINKAASPTYANQAFQQEEPDDSLKSYVNTKTSFFRRAGLSETTSRSSPFTVETSNLQINCIFGCYSNCSNKYCW